MAYPVLPKLFSKCQLLAAVKDFLDRQI